MLHRSSGSSFHARLQHRQIRSSVAPAERQRTPAHPSGRGAYAMRPCVFPPTPPPVGAHTRCAQASPRPPTASELPFQFPPKTLDTHPKIG
jgi:hypothetical protein